MTIENGHEDFLRERDESAQPAGSASAGSAYAQVYAFGQNANGPESNPAPEAARPDDGDGAAAPAYTPSGDETAEDAPPHGFLCNGDALAEGEENGHAPGMELSDDLTAKLDGFTRPASDCINKARRIARELNHTSVSAAHLVLAMTLDSRANRRLRDRGVDVDEVRETAIQLLAKHNNLYSDGQHDPAESPRPAPDLADILEAAARYAQESEDEEEIKITDLLDAFPKSGSRARLIYDPQGFSDQVPAVVRRVEQTLAAQMDTLIAGLENTVLASTQDRLDSMVGGVSAQLNEQIAALRQANMLLSEHVRVILQAKRPEAEDRGRWPWK